MAYSYRLDHLSRKSAAAASSTFGFRVAYASWTEVVFVFEGGEVEWIVTEIVNEPSGAVAEAPGRGAGPSRIRHASRGPSIPGKRRGLAKGQSPAATVSKSATWRRPRRPIAGVTARQVWANAKSGCHHSFDTPVAHLRHAMRPLDGVL